MKRRSDVIALAEAEEGLALLGCLAGSPAALAGLRYGDIVLSVNGIRTRNIKDYLRAKNECGGLMEIVYRRDGDVHTVSVEYDASTPQRFVPFEPSSNDSHGGLPMLRPTVSSKPN